MKICVCAGARKCICMYAHIYIIVILLFLLFFSEALPFLHYPFILIPQIDLHPLLLFPGLPLSLHSNTSTDVSPTLYLLGVLWIISASLSFYLNREVGNISWQMKTQRLKDDKNIEQARLS